MSVILLPEGDTEVAGRPRRYSGGTMLRNSLSGICGALSLDRTEVMVGEKVGVYWDIPGVIPHENDWIGLLEASESKGGWVVRLFC